MKSALFLEPFSKVGLSNFSRILTLAKAPFVAHIQRVSVQERQRRIKSKGAEKAPKIILRWVLIAFSVSSGVLAGGGWTQKKGEGLFMLSERMISGRFYFNNTRQVIESPLLGIYTSNLYAEYGFTNRFTAILYTPFLTVATREPGTDSAGNIFTSDKALGIGDIDIGLKYGLVNKKLKLAATAFFGIPSGNYYAGSSDSLHLGDGEFSQMVKLDASMGLAKGMFFTLFAGINNRTRQFSDEVHYGGEYGFTKKGFTAILKVYARNSLFNEVRKDSPVPGIYSDNVEYLAITPQLLYTFKGNIGIMAEAGFAVLGRNIIAAPSFNFGFYWKLEKSESEKQD